MDLPYDYFLSVPKNKPTHNIILDELNNKNKQLQYILDKIHVLELRRDELSKELPEDEDDENLEFDQRRFKLDTELDTLNTQKKKLYADISWLNHLHRENNQGKIFIQEDGTLIHRKLGNSDDPKNQLPNAQRLPSPVTYRRLTNYPTPVPLEKYLKEELAAAKTRGQTAEERLAAAMEEEAAARAEADAAAAAADAARVESETATAAAAVATGPYKEKMIKAARVAAEKAIQAAEGAAKATVVLATVAKIVLVLSYTIIAGASMVLPQIIDGAIGVEVITERDLQRIGLSGLRRSGGKKINTRKLRRGYRQKTKNRKIKKRKTKRKY